MMQLMGVQEPGADMRHVCHCCVLRDLALAVRGRPGPEVTCAALPVCMARWVAPRWLSHTPLCVHYRRHMPRSVTHKHKPPDHRNRQSVSCHAF